MDFFADVVGQARSRLQQAGYAVNVSENAEEVCIKYFNIAKRRVQPQPRRIVFSQEFTCPANLQPGLDELRKKSETGENLKPHQSKSLTNYEYDDSLLNDWGIQHFHLGITAGSDGFVERTGPLLFARVTDDVIYCINVLAHGAWSKQEMVAILHKNWPETITRFRVKEIAPEILTDENIRRLRKGNVNAFVVMEDRTIYVSIGGGLTASGKGLEVILACDQVKRLCRLMEERVRTTAAALGVQQDFRLEVRSNRTLAVAQNGLMFDLGEALLFKPL
jgi:hypothetical protein